MRIGLYIHNYTPTSGGGYTFQRAILKAVSELASQSKHHFYTLTYFHKEWYSLQDHLGSIEFIPIESASGASRNLPHRLWRNLKKVKSPTDRAILSALDFTAKKHHIEFIWFITPAYELTDVPYLATVWDLQHRLQPWFPEVGNLAEWDGRETYIATFLKRAAYIIALNEAGRKEIHLFYQIPEDRVICLTLPTPELISITPEAEQAALKKNNLQPGFLFYPAQYWAHKNHANLLFALKELRESLNLIPTVVFVGSDKGNLAYLKKLAAELGIQSQVRFHGFVTDSELAAFYKNALALVYPSFFGPENLPPLEAFSVGCPVIAANVSGADEQLGNAALLVNPARADEIALAIKSLLNNPRQRETLIKRGFKRAKQATGSGYAKQVLRTLDEFELTRRAWES